jgi:DNA-binding YbaB/EbfC family protein
MQAVQKELETATVEATAGGGVVKAVVSGAQKVVSITIAPEVLSDDPEMVADLVTAAVNEALDRSRDMAAQRMQSVTAGLGLPPGLLG